MLWRFRANEYLSIRRRENATLFILEPNEDLPR